ncbi:unnamed protein product [Cunninghamella blakesleeana]
MGINVAIDNIVKKLEGLTVSTSTMYDFINNDLGFTFEKTQFHNIKRNGETTIEKRIMWINQWKDTDIDFLKNYVFNDDESGFHINMNRTQSVILPNVPNPIVVGTTTDHYIKFLEDTMDELVLVSYNEQTLDEETLQMRIAYACLDVPNSYVYEFVKHSASRLNGCLNRVPM